MNVWGVGGGRGEGGGYWQRGWQKRRNNVYLWVSSRVSSEHFFVFHNQAPILLSHTHISVYLSICLSVYLSVGLSVCLSVCLCIYIVTIYLYSGLHKRPLW